LIAPTRRQNSHWQVRTPNACGVFLVSKDAFSFPQWQEPE